MNTRLSAHPRLRSLALVASLAAAGCQSAVRFTRTDDSFVPAGRATPSEVWLTEPPVEDFRVVGTLDVGVSAEATPEELAAAAARQGQAIGCDFVIAGALVPPGRAGRGVTTPDGSRIRLVHEGHDSGGGRDTGMSTGGVDRSGATGAGAPERRVFHRFVCAEAVPAGTGAATGI